ncbi:MAG: AbrB/MazE/SpoVT family DNA-binding domain-containing protein [Nanoarchaeota archaeon]|nr:AbrB/MazE/SpoVT family DNA-binding domain-containing protein [Nanoarchaeota archaeon]MBU1622963.1 AbrB/MazE/SpoVT family DNA-binding domain-containing protein [Nanoarchaeota archaeon]MBU1974574.1 AbrB/MazE/SpoVT family DNA-binding domain-containing protein [Nanoarchaeota archaeon]
MEYRKLISFGKSSYVVSLPKNWVNQQNLKKGDLIYIDENEGNLVLQPQPSKIDEKEIFINIDGKSLSHIKRELISAYIKNNRTITFLGNEIKNRAKDLQPIIQSLIALEVMEQDSKKIVAKDFLNFESISTQSLIRKMDILIRSMLTDCENMFTEDTSESINYRDNDVNKLTFLIFRIAKFGLENPAYVGKYFNLKSNSLLSLWALAADMELMADEVKCVAGYMHNIKLNKKKQEEFVVIIKQARENYQKIMKAYYDQKGENVHEAINDKEELINRCVNFYLENREVQWIGFLTNRTKGIIKHIAHIGRTVYQW